MVKAELTAVFKGTSELAVAIVEPAARTFARKVTV
jgi:hypothetical protein